MAISMENPQDPGNYYNVVEDAIKRRNNNNNTASSSASTTGMGLRKKRQQQQQDVSVQKPSRTWMYVRTQATYHSSSQLSFRLMGLILAVLTVHRMCSLYMSHRQWINAPITYMERTCPTPPYERLSNPASDAGTICLTTLTDYKSNSLLQRFIRWRNFDGILELTWPNKAKYAAKHSYRLYDGSGHIDTTRPPAWSKIPAVKALLEQQGDKRCDWVLWTDADTVIMNSDVRVQDFLPKDPTKDLLVGSDNGGGYNSGVFLIRNSEWSKSFLDQWWNMKSFVRPPGFSLSGDNNAMKALLATMPDFDQHVLVPARCTLNSFAMFLTLAQSMAVINDLDHQEWYQNENFYHHGDFIAHTPGYDNKAECIRLLLKEAT